MDRRIQRACRFIKYFENATWTAVNAARYARALAYWREVLRRELDLNDKLMDEAYADAWQEPQEDIDRPEEE